MARVVREKWIHFFFPEVRICETTGWRLQATAGRASVENVDKREPGARSLEPSGNPEPVTNRVEIRGPFSSMVNLMRLRSVDHGYVTEIE
jgi:hypothetical protein